MTKNSYKSFKILMVVLLVYAGLVATHKGEFWPFSIYPMFSKAGQPWTRALVRDVTDIPDSLAWQTKPLQDIENQTISLAQIGANQIDFSNFVSKTTSWNWNRRRALIVMFGKNNIDTSRWMVCKVNGHLTDTDSVIVDVVPLLMVKRDTVLENPNLPEKVYNSNK